MATVKCVHGAPCSGKSTYVRENVGANDIVWDLDLVRNAIAGQSERSSDEQNDMILRLRDTYMSSCSESPCDTAWFICTRVTNRIREALGEGTEYIEMEATEAECLERLEADDSRTDKDLYRELIHDFFENQEVRRMPKNNREYRSMELRTIQREAEEEESYMVEGYASTFEPYVLTTIDGVDYSERIDPKAFDDADMSDVVFRVDHEGRVYARSSAGTVKLWTDEHGLGQRTDLGKTQKARELFADIEAGNYPQMSFAFTVSKDHYDKETHTRVIDRIAKVYDVSAVSFPANPTTNLSVATRDYFNGVIEAEKAERLEREELELRKKKLQLRAKFLKGD